MATLVWYGFSIGGALFCLLACALWVWLSHGSRASRRVSVAVFLTYWIASTWVVPSTVVDLLAHGFTPLSAAAVPHGRTAVVLLGSGAFQFRDWDGTRYTVTDDIGAARLTEAARVFHLLNADYVVSSGGLLRTSDRAWPSGIAMADGLVALGVPRERIVIETESGTTREEALIIKPMLAARPVDNVVLVTTRSHMRRSVGTFRAVGITVIPAIAREPTPMEAWWERVLPTDKGLEESAMAAHEVTGVIGYSLRGWYR